MCRVVERSEGWSAVSNEDGCLQKNMADSTGFV